MTMGHIMVVDAESVILIMDKHTKLPHLPKPTLVVVVVEEEQMIR